MLFSPESYSREDDSSDALFYAEPRFVAHIDEGAIAAVTQLYREYLPPKGTILDLMSSWISHLPPEVKYKSVTGLGMNDKELSANPRLNHFVVHDLNRTPSLPFDSGQFDAAAICVSIDYLTAPVAVLRDLGRVLKHGGPVIVTISNRCFPTKAITAWLRMDDSGRCRLVAGSLAEAGNWHSIEVLDRRPSKTKGDPLFGIVACSSRQA